VVEKRIACARFFARVRGRCLDHAAVVSGKTNAATFTVGKKGVDMMLKDAKAA
jgi:hypothetical protein